MPGVTYEEYLKTKEASSAKLAAKKKEQVATEKSSVAEK
jgi:hypothetical protein